MESWTARTLSFSFGFSFNLWIDFHSTLISSRELDIRRPWYATPVISFSFTIRLTFGCGSARGGLFNLSFTGREMLLTNLLFEVADHLFFQSGVVSRCTLVNSILTVQRQQWLQLL